MIEQLVAKAVQSVSGANNGYADIGRNEEVAARVERAGLIVIRTRDLHGNPVFRGFTPAAQKALAVSPFGVSTYKPAATPLGVQGDMEGAILARQEARSWQFS